MILRSVSFRSNVLAVNCLTPTPRLLPCTCIHISSRINRTSAARFFNLYLITCLPQYFFSSLIGLTDSHSDSHSVSLSSVRNLPTESLFYVMTSILNIISQYFSSLVHIAITPGDVLLSTDLGINLGDDKIFETYLSYLPPKHYSSCFPNNVMHRLFSFSHSLPDFLSDLVSRLDQSFVQISLSFRSVCIG